MIEARPILRPLGADEAAPVARHPLPPGVPDAPVNKAQLETALGVSQTTLSAWLRQGLPFEEAGTNGRSYQFRLSIAHAWVAAKRADDDAQRAAGDTAAAQLQMALLGGATAGAADGKLSLADQRKLIELELQHMAAARERKALVWRDDARGWFETAFSAVRDALEALPDRMARKIGLDGRQMEKMQTDCDDVLRSAHRAISEMVEEELDGRW